MRRVNLRLILGIAGLVVLAGLGVVLLNRFQVRRNAEQLVGLATAKIEAGDAAEAIQLLTRYLTLRPDDDARRIVLANLLLDRAESGQMSGRDLRSAVGSVEVAVRKNPDDLELRERFAAFLTGIGDFDNALDHLSIVISKKPEDPDQRLQLLYGVTAARARRTDEAERTLSRVLGYDPAGKTFPAKGTTPPGREEAFALLAAILEADRRDTAGAEAVIRRMSEAYPEEPKALKILALWDLDHGRVEDAANAAARAVELDPDDDAAAIIELNAAVRLKDFDRADRLIAGALADAPLSEVLVKSRGDLARARGDVEGMLALLDEGLKAMPDSKNLMMERLLMLADLRRIDDLRAAVGEYKSRLGEKNVAVLYAGAMLDMADRRWMQALRSWEGLRPEVAADPLMTRRIDLALALCHAALGQPDQAVDARTRAFAATPGSGGARFSEMAGHEAAGRWDDALGIAEQLVEAIPEEKLAEMPELWRPLFRLRIIEQVRRPENVRDWRKVESLLRTLGDSAEVGPAVIERLRIDLQTAQGDTAGAIEASAEAVAAHPEDSGLLAQRVILLVSTGRPQDAQTLLDAVPESLRDSTEVLGAEIDLAGASPAAEAGRWMADVEKRLAPLTGPTAERLTRQLITVHVGRGNPEQAERIAETFLATHPDDLPVHELLLDIADERNDVQGVRSEADIIGRIAGKDSATGRVAEAVARIVAVRKNRIDRLADDVTTGPLTAEERRDLEAARALLAQAAADRPRWSEVPRQLAAVAEIQGDTGAAIGHLRQAIDFRESLPFARRRLALLLTAAGRLDEARPVIESLGNAAGPRVDQVRADWLAAAGSRESALEIAARIVPADSRDPDRLIWYGGLLARCGQTDAAVAVCNRAIEAAPERADAWLTLLRLELSLGRREVAERIGQQALTSLTGSSRERFEVVADEILGGTGDVEASTRAKVEADPRDLAAARKYVEVLVRRGRTAEAQQELRRILALDSVDDPRTMAWARRILANQLSSMRGYAELQQALALLAQNVDAEGRQEPEDLAAAISMLVRRDEPASWRQALAMLDTLSTRRTLTVEEQLMKARLQILLFPATKNRNRDELVAIASSNNTSTAVTSTLVELLIDSGDLATARIWLDRLKAVAAAAPGTIRLEARLALAQKDGDRARTLVAQLFPDEKLNASNAPRLLAAVPIAEQLGFPELAARVVEEYGRLSPEGAVAQSRWLSIQNRASEAVELLGTVRDRVAPPLFLDALVQALRHSDPQRDADAIATSVRWLDAALRENPDSTETRIQVALAHDTLGRTDEAQRLYRELLDSGSMSEVQRGIVAANLAWILAQPGTTDEASDLVDMAVRQIGPHPDLLDTRALVRLAKGQMTLALEDIEDALLRPSAVKYLHLADIQLANKNIDAARAAMTKSREMGLESIRLTPSDEERIRRVDEVINLGSGES